MKHTQYNDNKIINFFFQVFLILILTIFNTIFIGSILFIFRQPINNWIFPLSMFLSFIFIFLKYKKEKNYILPIIFSIILILFSVIISGKIIDYTADGNTYHKLAIGNLKEGWNPVYQNQQSFGTNKDKKKWEHKYFLWGNTYAKGHYIFGASVYKTFGKIETAKSINFISFMALFILLLIFSYIKSNKKIFSIIFSLSLSTVTTITSQLMTNYIDGLVFIYFFMLIVLNYIIYEKFINNNKKFDLFNNNLLFLLLMIDIVILMNIKFSSFAYAGLFSLGYFIYFLFTYIKDKSSDNLILIKKYFFTGLLSLFIGVFIVGLSTYPKNLKNHGNIFYPLRGKGKVDIITTMQPVSFKNKRPFSKFIISTFSKVENVTYGSNKRPELKIPFTFKKDEIKEIYLPDIRIGGNGLFFSGILIVSIILLIIQFVKIFNNKKLFIFNMIPIFLTIFLSFTLTEVWWARYFPQIFLFVLLPIVLIIDEKNQSRYKELMVYMIMVILIINNLFVITNSIDYSYNHTKYVNDNIYLVQDAIKKNNCNIQFNIPLNQGYYYNIADKLKTNFTIVSSDKIDNHDGIIINEIKWKCLRSKI